MSVLYIIKFAVKSDSQLAFANVMDNVKFDLPKVEGCSGVEIHRGLEDESSYVLLETWVSKALHEKHIEGLVDSGAWESIAAHLSEDPVGGYYQSV